MKIAIQIFLLLLWIPSAVSQDSRQNRVDSLLSSMHSKKMFNGVALVSDGGNVIVHKAYGLSDREHNESLSVADRFYIGSLTKQFTAVLILQLQEDGLIDIKNPISTYLREFKDPTWSEITVHHLLTHTSGFGSYTSNPNFDKSIAYADQEMFEFIKHPLLFKPGTDWSYSNSGYFLLGKIAERVAGSDYGTLLNENIFKPLNMSSSSFSMEWLDERWAKGYHRTIAGLKPMPTYSLETLFSTGGIYATAGDLYIWTQALEGNKLLTDTSKETLYQPVKNDYACGLYIKKGRDEDGNKFERHFHGGIIQGYHLFMLKRVPQKQVIILLDNYHNQEIQTIKNRIWSILEDEPVRIIKPKLSQILYKACTDNVLIDLLDSISNNLAQFEKQYALEEFDINTVGYRLMADKRYGEATALFHFNITRYPESWNVYDSMGELQLQQKNYIEAEKLYRQSLVLNPESTSAKSALEKIKRTTTQAPIKSNN